MQEIQAHNATEVVRQTREPIVEEKQRNAYERGFSSSIGALEGYIDSLQENARVRADFAAELARKDPIGVATSQAYITGELISLMEVKKHIQHLKENGIF